MEAIIIITVVVVIHRKENIKTINSNLHLIFSEVETNNHNMTSRIMDMVKRSKRITKDIKMIDLVINKKMKISTIITNKVMADNKKEVTNSSSKVIKVKMIKLLDKELFQEIIAALLLINLQ